MALLGSVREEWTVTVVLTVCHLHTQCNQRVPGCTGGVLSPLQWLLVSCGTKRPIRGLCLYLSLAPLFECTCVRALARYGSFCPPVCIFHRCVSLSLCLSVSRLTPLCRSRALSCLLAVASAHPPAFHADVRAHCAHCCRFGVFRYVPGAEQSGWSGWLHHYSAPTIAGPFVNHGIALNKSTDPDAWDCNGMFSPSVLHDPQAGEHAHRSATATATATATCPNVALETVLVSSGTTHPSNVPRLLLSVSVSVSLSPYLSVSLWLWLSGYGSLALWLSGSLALWLSRARATDFVSS